VLDLILPLECGGCGAPSTRWCDACATELVVKPDEPHVINPRVDPQVPVFALGRYVGARRRAILAVKEHGRLKKQSGGHGQFADVKIDIAPRSRGEGFEFVDKIVGGAVPRNFIPAVAEAAEESAKKGPFGFPVVDISVTLVDGGFHSVDSSDMAFKTATSLAMKEGLAKADPILLEPVDHVTISVPNEFTPRAQRLLTGRRGQILGFAEKEGWPGWDDVVALVPEAELHDLIIDLRSQTLGLGTYRRKFDHLAESRAEVKRGAA